MSKLNTSHLVTNLAVAEAFNTSELNSSKIMPRWQRKALAASQLNSSTASAHGTPGRKGDRSFTSDCSPSTDRYIANRSAMNLDASHYALTGGDDGGGSSRVLNSSALLNTSVGGGEDGGHFRRNLAANLLPSSAAAASAAGGVDHLNSSATVAEASFSSSASAAGGGVGGDDGPSFSSLSSSSSRVLAFRAKAPPPPDGHASSLRVLYTQNKGAAPRVKTARHIPSAPERILDAPDMGDDYYLNLLDWSAANVLAVGLGPRVYTWNAVTGSAEQLAELPGADELVTSVAWIKEGGGYLAVGTSTGEVQLWDASAGRQVRSMRGHAGRVGALDWTSAVLSSGSRDGSIFHHDVRVREHHVATLGGHTQEVCGLAWSPDGAWLASGSNDNTLCLWEGAAAPARGTTAGGVQAPRFVLTSHQAAVKALAWCPWQKGLLASGGGTADRCIKTWNAGTGALLASVDSGSQVSALAWNPHERELLSSHGFTNNQLTLWAYPGLTRMKELTGHTSRVLHMAVSPDGSTVASAAADETIRFWRVFGEPAGSAGKGGPAGASSGSGGSSGVSAMNGLGAKAPGGGAIMRGLAIR